MSQQKASKLTGCISAVGIKIQSVCWWGALEVAGQLGGEQQYITMDLLCWLSGKITKKTKKPVWIISQCPPTPEETPGEMLAWPITQRTQA